MILTKGTFKATFRRQSSNCSSRLAFRLFQLVMLLSDAAGDEIASDENEEIA